MVKYFNGMRSILQRLSPIKNSKISRKSILRNPFSSCSDSGKGKKPMFAMVNVNRSKENTIHWYREIYTLEFPNEYKECLPLFIGFCLTWTIKFLFFARHFVTRDDIMYTKKRPYDGMNIDFMHPKSRKFVKYRPTIKPNPQLCKIYREMREAKNPK